MNNRSRSKGKPKRAAMTERLTLADARRRVDEFKNIKPVEGFGGGAAIPAGKIRRTRKR